MIKLIVNGFPRTGSTITYKMLKAGNPAAFHLFEPLHDNLFGLLEEEENIMHGGSLFDGYKEISESVLSKMKIKHADSTNLYRFEECEPYLDVINSIDGDVFLQPNRMHFVLKDAARKYDCKAVHLCRNPADCFLGFAEIFAMYGKDLTKNYNWWIDNIYGFVGFFNNQYESISAKFNAPKVTHFFDKWLVLWAYLNFYAALQSDGKRVQIVFFEDIVSGTGIDFVEKFGGVTFGNREIIDPDRVFLADDEFKEIVEKRIQDLGLSDMVREIYKRAKI